MKKISDETARVARKHLLLVALTKSMSIEEEDAIYDAMADLADPDARESNG